MSDAQVGRASLIIAAGTLTSRILGVGRLMLFSYAVGATGLASNAHATAMKIPNTVYVLIITGALTAVLVPQITKAALAKDGGQRYINKLVTLAIVATVALIPVVVAITPPLIRALGPSWSAEQLHLAMLFAWWLLPQIVFFSLYTVVGEVLNAKSYFGPYSWSPVLANLISIGGLIAFIIIYGADPSGSAPIDRWDPLAIALVAGSATLGVAVQGLVLFGFWGKVNLRYRIDLRFRGIGLSTMGRVAFWLFLTVLAAQLVGLVYTLALNTAFTDDLVGAQGWETVRTIAVMPHSVIVISLVMANFTRMSESVHEGKPEVMTKHLLQASRTTVVMMVFIIAAMSVLAMPIMRILLYAAPHHLIAMFAPLLIITMIGMLAQSLLFVFNRGFYALSDTKRPFFIALGSSTAALVGALISMQMPQHLIANTLAFSEALITFAQVIATFLVLRSILGHLSGRLLLKSLTTSTLAAVAAVAAGLGLIIVFGGLGETSFPVASLGTALVTCLAVTIAMGIVYLVALRLMRSDDLAVIGALSGKLTRRFTR